MAFILIRDGYINDHTVNRSCYFCRKEEDINRLMQELQQVGKQLNEVKVDYIKLNHLQDLKAQEAEDRRNELIIK